MHLLTMLMATAAAAVAVGGLCSRNSNGGDISSAQDTDSAWFTLFSRQEGPTHLRLPLDGRSRSLIPIQGGTGLRSAIFRDFCNFPHFLDCFSQ